MHIQAAGKNIALVVDLGHKSSLRLLLLLITPKVCLWGFHPKSSQASLFLWVIRGCAVPGPRADAAPMAQLCILEMLSIGVTGQTKLLDLTVPLLCQAITDSVHFSKSSQGRLFLGFSLAVHSFLNFKECYLDSASNVQWIPAHHGFSH